jgi:hypothetical protein
LIFIKIRGELTKMLELLGITGIYKLAACLIIFTICSITIKLSPIEGR